MVLALSKNMWHLKTIVNIFNGFNSFLNLSLFTVLEDQTTNTLPETVLCCAVDLI